jgi:hypothetical protein
MKKGSKPFKKLVMLKAKIKTHKLGTTYNQPHFFILNKGNNSGKPYPQHWSNCFVFLADDDQDKEFFYLLFLGLWELKFFKKHLIGSVIEYIRLGDLVDVVEETVNSVNAGERTFVDVAPALAQIESHTAQLQKQLSYLLQLRRSLFYKYLNK